MTTRQKVYFECLKTNKLENHRFTILFTRYLEKKASPEEIKLLLEHFRMEEENEQLKDMICAQMAQPLANENVISIHEDNVYKRVAAALDERIGAEENRKSFWRSTLVRIAASVAAILLIVTAVVLRNNLKPSNMATAYASYGKLKEVRLPDNSRAWLDAGTIIEYPDHFVGNTRTVTLKNGEAYFEVVHDAHKPFVVKTTNAEITVLGTSFEVTAYEKDSQTKVAVRTGKVGVQLANHAQPATFLLPGQSAIISNANLDLRITKKAVADIAVWREQRLIFEDQPLAEVMQSLERKYNVHIRIDNDKLLSETITMRLNNQPLTDVLTAISFANHFNYEIINDQLVVVK